MSGQPREAVHRDPIWRDQADFIIGIETASTSKQLWARTVDESHFMICRPDRSG